MPPAAIHLDSEGLKNTVLLSGGTDGEDGPTDAAGAWADGTSLARAETLGVTEVMVALTHERRMAAAFCLAVHR